MLLSRVEMKPSDLFEHIPRHHHPSKLEQKPPGMAHQPSTYLDEPRLDTCQRPALYGLRQSQPSEKVAQIVGQDEQPQPHLVSHELVTREPSPIEGVLPFLDPLLRCASAIVEVDYS